MVFVDKQNKAMKEDIFFASFFGEKTKEELQNRLFALMKRRGGHIVQMSELTQQ